MKPFGEWGGDTLKSWNFLTPWVLASQSKATRMAALLQKLSHTLKQFCLSYVGYSYKKEITFCIKTDHSVDVPLDFQVPESFYCL